MTVDSGGDEDLALAAFEAPRLTGIASRILGSVDDAQDPRLRWAAVPGSEVRHAEALLATIVTRLPVDRLRRAKTQREACRWGCLAEPLRAQADPEAAAGRAEASVRQLVHCARARVQDGEARYDAGRGHHAQVVEQFRAACQPADSGALLKIMAPDVVLHSDGGAVAQAPPRPTCGSGKISQLMQSIAGGIPGGHHELGAVTWRPA
ncbi:MAG TPA: hypothetical protein VHN16_06625 [Streptosporangiaceae bacterium]|jgi:RNA polymerase sigma-70 factor (ECF subfamily)|nr:hypothetical protein [Streptosporangiaceae bacterium]